MCPAACMSAEVAESSLVTLPFLSRPKALPAKYEYDTSNELRAFLASLGVVCCQLALVAYKAISDVFEGNLGTQHTRTSPQTNCKGSPYRSTVSTKTLRAST